jgi:hypothetical protein
MRAHLRDATLFVVLALVSCSNSIDLLAQETAAVTTPAAAAAPPVLSPEEMERFLLNAKVIRTRGVSTGINNTSRATLSDGRITHDAHIQTVDIARAVFVPQRGPSEINFKDSYRYNIAAYRLARLLGLNHVPMSVERHVERSTAAVTWWVDDVLMDEGVRFKKGAPKEWDPSRTASQIHIMRVFDELIANQDRNAGNLLWTTDGKMWMIDHTRGFRLASSLKNPRLLERCEIRLLGALRTLTLETVTEAAGQYLWKSEIEALLDRRTAIVDLFDAMIKERGQRFVLYAFSEP